MEVEERTIEAGPTKRFFVEMLTRDIELEDAILDLVDNCVDGVLRTLEALDEPVAGERPYEGYFAEITATPDKFEIADNCGGIPKEVARKSAFMFGRPDERDGDIKTVGMYGIGMKRAIFKMGRESVVTSQPADGPYKVEISREWLGDDENWQLSLEPLTEGLAANGTTVEVTELLPNIAWQFDQDRSSFLSDLHRQVSQLFALILQKGFRVAINGSAVEPAPISLLAPEDWSNMNAIRPYLFDGVVDGVQVELAVGFYRPLATEEELDQESESPQRESFRAGWTVICNDRVVLYGDKSRITGWGQGNVPQYHSQFRAIAGVVVFESVNSLKLPLTTTKRALDTSSDVYLEVRDYMMEGTKVFTSFTNKWKARERETSEAFQMAEARSVGELQDHVSAKDWSNVAKVAARGEGNSARRYKPDLPTPAKRGHCGGLRFHGM